MLNDSVYERLTLKVALSYLQSAVVLCSYGKMAA